MPNAVPRTINNWSKNVNAQDINAMTFDQLVPSKSKYLTKDDVGSAGLILTIKGFRMETLESDDGNEDKMVLHFVEDVKPMVLNRTNAQLLAVATGAKSVGESKGRQIIVFNDPTVSFGGKVTGGLRIRQHTEERPKPAPARPAQPVGISAGREPSDDIPF